MYEKQIIFFQRMKIELMELMVISSSSKSYLRIFKIKYKKL